MTARDDVIDFTRGAMDRIRELADVKGDDGFLEFENGWSYVAPGGITYDFRIMPHNRLAVRVLVPRSRKNSNYETLAWVKDRDEAITRVAEYLRGV